jgi:hypothetical protein
MIQLKIPAAFIRARTRMCWRELECGLDHELIAHDAIADFAMESMAAVEVPSAVLLDLAGAGPGDQITELVVKLAQEEPKIAEGLLTGKWLYIALAWVYEQRDALRDPLELVELIYADFGYPEEISRLVGYMPSDEPSLGSPGANRDRLVGRWKRYLDEKAATYAP